jgi:hypothetical protein
MCFNERPIADSRQHLVVEIYNRRIAVAESHVSCDRDFVSIAEHMIALLFRVGDNMNLFTAVKSFGGDLELAADVRRELGFIFVLHDRHGLKVEELRNGYSFGFLHGSLTSCGLT